MRRRIRRVGYRQQAGFRQQEWSYPERRDGQHAAPILHTVLSALVVLCLLTAGTSTGSAKSPDSPDVLAMVNKATKFLEKAEHTALGGKCIIAYALLKADHEKYLSHQQIQNALEACRRDNAKANDSHLYSVAMATLFLCEHDAVANAQLIEQYIANIVARQKSHGGWGYRDRTRGDTSQTQYAILALWTAHQKRIAVPISSLERAANWLVQVQDPSGAFGYQAIVPPGNQRVAQFKVSHSLTVASLGSLYLLGDTLKLSDFAPNPVRGPVTEIDAPPIEPLTDNIDVAALKLALRDGNQWFANRFDITQDDWNYYYLYAIERYMSFRDHAENRNPPTARWYDAGVALLKTRQAKDGHFHEPVGTEEGGDAIGTAFATLFLVRSSRQSLKSYWGESTHVPILDHDLGQIRVTDDGEIVLPFEIPDDVEIPQSTIANLRATDHQTRIRTIHRIAHDPQLDDVPALLYALTDPDVTVVRVARNSLRKISRKIDGFGLSDRPTESEKSRVHFQWKRWYLSIKPDADLTIAQ